MFKRTRYPLRREGAFAGPLARSVLLPWFVFIAAVVFGYDAETADGGGMTRSCRELIVFEGANVNNYVKQFAGVTDPELPLDRTGRMLALLVQLDGLYSQIGYGPLGYVYVKTGEDDPRTCTNELILKRVMGEECCSGGELQEGRAALLLSGHFQRAEDQIYLLTSVEFLRKGTDETVGVPSQVPGEDQIDFIAQLPRSAVSFAPRKFSKEQLLQVADAYSEVMYVREAPSDDARARKIEPFDIDGFSYYIEEVRQGWLKIRSYRGGLPSGWVRVPEDIGGLGLRELLPELYYMDAAAVYLQTRIGGRDLSPARRARHLKKFESLLRAFAERTRGPGDRRALGLLKSMHATLMLERPGPKITEKELKRIAHVAAEAADLLPTSTEARALAALSRFAVSIQSGDSSFSRIAPRLEQDLLEVLSTDPANAYVKANLEKLWRLRTTNDRGIWKTEKLSALRERFLRDRGVQQLLR